MKASGPISLPERLSAGQRDALVTLLADEDPHIARRIRELILSREDSPQKWLGRYRLADDPLARRRVNELLDTLARRDADHRFIAFCLRHGEDLDIEEGAWLLAATTYPTISIDGYRALLDYHADILSERIGHISEPRRLLGIINRYIFEELHFTGNEQDYYDPENSYLNAVMDRRTGNPISLGLIYLMVCQRLQLPVVGVGLPGHFLCRLQTASRELYIDTFRGGLLLTKADCIHYLVHSNYSLREEYLGPMSPRRMLMRVIGNLQQIYQQTGLDSEALRMRGYLLALRKDRTVSNACST